MISLTVNAYPAGGYEGDLQIYLYLLLGKTAVVRYMVDNNKEREIGYYYVLKLKRLATSQCALSYLSSK